jgi:hypothetical protein
MLGLIVPVILMVLQKYMTQLDSGSDFTGW